MYNISYLLVYMYLLFNPLPNVADQQQALGDWQGGPRIIRPAKPKAVISKIDTSSPSPFRFKNNLYFCVHCRQSTTFVTQLNNCPIIVWNGPCQFYQLN